MRLASLAGDFVAAERYADEWRIGLEGQRQLSLRAAVTGDLLDLYSESGQMARAGAVASDFLAREAAWSSDAVVDDDTLVHDVTPAALDVARHAHAITPSQYREGLASWLARMNRLTQPQFKPFVWLVGEADVAETRAEANDALRDLPATGVPPYRPRERGPGLGRAFLLAGRDEEAVHFLEGTAARCDALSDPYGNTRAHELLGEALARRGHAQEACDQYALVLSRWGHARPRSITAERAASRARSLSCPMPRRSP